MSFVLTSPAFVAGSPIPAEFTCDGRDISPPLAWGLPPEETQSLALVMDDPDAPVGTWDHWVLFNLPPTARGLPADLPADPERPDGSRHGRNSWHRLGYGGPCPPRGLHHYVFRLVALDALLGLAAGSTKAELERAMAGHVLATAELVGTYTRRQGTQ
jgi:Raf kinase inhibitor-like YbhB/YbcL family protein